MDPQRALYIILMFEKFQQVTKIFLATDFTLNGRVVDFAFICSSQNWLKPMKMIGHFRNWNIRQNGFLVGHVRRQTFNSTAEMWNNNLFILQKPQKIKKNCHELCRNY